MKFQVKPKFTLLAVAIAASFTAGQAQANGYEVQLDVKKFSVAGANQEVKNYIVQVAGQTGIEKAAELGELKPASQLVGAALNQYNSESRAVKAHTSNLSRLHEQLVAQYASSGLLYSYTHTFNGFAARLTGEQAENLRRHPDVVGVWEDVPQQLQTARTPALLGLTGPGGQHTNNIKGDGIVIGIVDTGIWPENPSFADDGTYTMPEHWKGECIAGEEAPAVTCNNKLIGARYFKSSFESVYQIQPGEFLSPRDADSHGSHVASTAAGNAGVSAEINNEIHGTVMGVAPRAQIAAYKVCWNSDYVSPEGKKESGCFYGDSMAAIDAAVADGVDVINYSIGGSLTDLTTIAAAAKLRATQAGVVMAVAAGNDGRSEKIETVGTPAPWVISVAASGYNVNEIEVASESVNGRVTAVEGSAGRLLNLTGVITGDIAVAEPLKGCTPLTNAEALQGKVVLLSRGDCDFVTKIANAEAAGAKGVVVHNNVAGAPFAMGVGTGVVNNNRIPGVMIGMDDGVNIAAAVMKGEAVQVTLDPSFVSNAMADFSSKGPNKAVNDIIKPDIAAPGVNVLAAATPENMSGTKGNNFTYMSGTSMASPHIAGMAALLKQQHPDWSPAMIKSALMTSAGQSVTKASSFLPAGIFDFGSGQAQPVLAATPGLVYDTTANEYFAFMCGLGKNSFVQAESGFSCAAFTEAGYSTESAQLNQPAIGVGSLITKRTVVREVTDVSGVPSTYTPNIEAPAGVDVTFKTLNSDGQLVESNSLNVPANGKAVYALTMTSKADAVYGQWSFGSLTLSDGVHKVRSPIAVKPIEPQLIDVPASLSVDVPAKSGRVTFLANMSYSGATSAKLVGLNRAVGTSGKVTQDNDGVFEFNEPGLGSKLIAVPAGTKVARFSLRNQMTSVADADLDLIVYKCVKWSCAYLTESSKVGSNEDVVLVNPEPAADASVGDVYLMWVHGKDLKGAATANYTMAYWIADKANTTTSAIGASPYANKGRPNVVSVSTRGLVPGALPYMGVASFYDAKGKEQDSTVLEVFAK
jgi:subtilisin family serine protease